MPTEAALAAVIKSCRRRRADRVRGHGEREAAARAVAQAGHGCEDGDEGGVGITEWTLSNGVRVVLDPTTFKQDEILFRAFSPGGTSLAGDADFVAAETADQVVAQGGLGTLSADRSRARSSRARRRSCAPTSTRCTEGLNGRALNRDLETMFQLIYLTFTQPRADPEAFRVMTGQLTAALANRQALPEAAFDDALNAARQPEPSARAAAEPRARRADEPREVDGVLQGSLRRRERLHVRLRRQLRCRDDQAARRALSRQPAVAAPQGSRRATSASGRRPASSRSW